METTVNTSNIVNRFYKSYRNMIDAIDLENNEKTELINMYLLSSFGYGPKPTMKNDLVEKELEKYSWSLEENKNVSNTITPAILGSVIEKVVNQKETGAYYTPKDTTHYIAKYTILFSLLCKCELYDLAFEFFNIYQKTSNVDILNSVEDPIKNLSLAINNLPDERKQIAYESILNFTVVDPTCGTGAFIVAAADILIDLFDAIEMQNYINKEDYLIRLFEKCLYGVDIEQAAISLINLRAKLYLYKSGIPYNRIEKIPFKFFCGDTLLPTNDFSWNSTFSDVISEGGFDCIIGNPPYVEQRKTKYTENDLSEYKTFSCGNLYAYVIEKSVSLLKENSYMGMIVPISLVSTQRMDALRNVLFSNGGCLYVSNFSDRPSCLFTGVHQKLSIFFFKKISSSSHCDVFSSAYIHWNKNEREKLFNKVKYQHISGNYITENGIAKIGERTQMNVLKKISSCSLSLNQFINLPKDKENLLYLNQRMTFWAKCFTAPEPSNEYKTYQVDSPYNNKAFAALLNSSLFYLLWESYSDCWHITQKDLNSLKLCDAFFDERNQEQLALLENELEQKLKDNREYIYSKQTDYIYVHRLCVNEIHKIDEKIALIFGFTQKECDYIKTYNLKYRISQSIESEEL